MKFAIVVPAYEEEEIIEEFIREVEAHQPSLKAELDVDLIDWSVVVVDDGSEDMTPQILKSLQQEFPNIVVLTHETNKGLGMALNTGLDYASNKLDAEIVLTMDADLTHPPRLIPELIKKLHEDDADISIASRYVKGGGMEGVPWWRVWISVVANLIFSLFFGIKAKDVTAGFKAYLGKHLKNLKIERPGFVVQLEIMVKLAKKKLKFTEVPLMLKNRQKGSSKFRFFRMMPKYGVQAIGLFFERWFG